MSARTLLRPRSRQSVLCRAFLAAAIGATACGDRPPQTAQAACDALSGRSIGGAQITSAAPVATSSGQPEYCQLGGIVPPQLRFEVRLPTEWNGRALFVGGGGLNGTILPPEVLLFHPRITARGYVTIGTDSGHQGTPLEGAWALDDPLAIENYAYLSTHTVLAAVREIVQARYGRQVERAYFIGMSTGGREALIAAQRWPEDFDGLVSLEPVYDLMALVLAEIHTAQRVFTVPGARLSEEKLRALAAGALAACDRLDGLEDGLIGNVADCGFVPESLRCGAEVAPSCLTDAEVETARLLRSELELGFALPHGIHGYPPWPVGHEDDPTAWPSWVVGTSADPASSLGFVIPDQFVKYFVTKDPEHDSLRFSPGDWSSQIVALAVLLNAADPDLSAFAARGGKLILWHGLADYGVSAYSSERYYRSVVRTMGQERVDRFLRFYLSPGVTHINGGPGAGAADFLAALEAWAERGEPPGDLEWQLAGAAGGTRPLCRYPGYPRYDGRGDPRSGTSFFCATPSAHRP
jgi:feruloyl esterase